MVKQLMQSTWCHFSSWSSLGLEHLVISRRGVQSGPSDMAHDVIQRSLSKDDQAICYKNILLI